MLPDFDGRFQSCIEDQNGSPAGVPVGPGCGRLEAFCEKLNRFCERSGSCCERSDSCCERSGSCCEILKSCCESWENSCGCLLLGCGCLSSFCGHRAIPEPCLLPVVSVQHDGLQAPELAGALGPHSSWPNNFWGHLRCHLPCAHSIPR